MVETNGQLVRACATGVSPGWKISTNSEKAGAAQREAFDRILTNHVLYCTVLRQQQRKLQPFTTRKDCWASNISRFHFIPSLNEEDHSNPFYRYDPQQCILCGRCVEACQNVQVNETLSINWEDPHPACSGMAAQQSANRVCVSCGHCITVCPCNALMEKSMLGHAGFLTALPKTTLSSMIDVVKGVEPETGYGAILKLSEAESHMRELRIRRTKTVCTYCGVGCSF